MARANGTLVGWLVVLGGAAALSMTAATVVISNGNRTLQREVNQRQQEVNQAVQLTPFSTQLIQTLAVMAVQRNDQQIGKVLSDNGITVQLNPPGAAVPSPVPPALPAPAPTPGATR